MTTNTTTQIRTWTTKKIFWFFVKFLIGGAFGAIAYLLIAKSIVGQTHIGCYETEFMRGVIEASTFLTSLLVQSTMGTQSIYYQPALYVLSSIPYAIIGSLIALRVKKLIILVVCLLTFGGLCLSWLLWAFFISSICA